MSKNQSKQKGKILKTEINRALVAGLSCADCISFGVSPSVRLPVLI